MGKTPDTLAGKLLKVRENKLRRNAGKQGITVDKLRNGSGYLLFVDGSRGALVDKAGGTSWRGTGTLTLSEAESALRQRSTDNVVSLYAG